MAQVSKQAGSCVADTFKRLGNLSSLSKPTLRLCPRRTEQRTQVFVKFFNLALPSSHQSSR
jgi:hypothetical protein